MKAAARVLLAAALALGGCAGGEGDPGSPGVAREPAEGDRGRPQRPGADTRRRAGEPHEAGAIRAWIAALNGGEYDRAASFFAAGAVVEQTEEVRLPDRAAAIAFNRSLPCKADVTDVEDEGATVLAAFRLRDGPGGGCDGGSARVRFRFRDGKFVEWRQLAEPDVPDGDIA